MAAPSNVGTGQALIASVLGTNVIDGGSVSVNVNVALRLPVLLMKIVYVSGMLGLKKGVVHLNEVSKTGAGVSNTVVKASPS